MKVVDFLTKHSCSYEDQLKKKKWQGKTYSEIIFNYKRSTASDICEYGSGIRIPPKILHESMKKLAKLARNNIFRTLEISNAYSIHGSIYSGKMAGSQCEQ